MCLLSLTANAQTTMRIEFEDGKQVDYPVSSITSIKWFTNENPDKSPAGAQAVDLGLSVKWANMNIGAISPEDYGDYFAWGETVGYKGGKKNFDTSTYKYYMSTTKDKDGFDVETKGYTKYVTKSDASEVGYDGFYDDKTVLDQGDDAAVANWGGTWRMPTEAEQEELRTKCTWTWAYHNGVNGYYVTSKVNGNYIFLPAAGFRDNADLRLAGDFGDYWSSSLSTNYSSYGSHWGFWPDCLNYGDDSRHSGLCVRAVCP